MPISLLDPEGVRHEINVETWVSHCCTWVVQQMEGRCTGRAARYREERTAIPIQTLGSTKTEYVAGVRTTPDAEQVFDEHPAPILCIACIGGDGGGGWRSP